MHMQDAIEAARRVAGGRAGVTRHYGANKHRHRGVRLLDCPPGGAEGLGREVAAALPEGRFERPGGLLVVWFDPPDESRHVATIGIRRGGVR